MRNKRELLTLLRITPPVLGRDLGKKLLIHTLSKVAVKVAYFPKTLRYMLEGVITHCNDVTKLIEKRGPKMRAKVETVNGGHGFQDIHVSHFWYSARRSDKPTMSIAGKTSFGRQRLVNPSETVTW